MNEVQHEYVRSIWKNKSETRYAMTSHIKFKYPMDTLIVLLFTYVRVELCSDSYHTKSLLWQLIQSVRNLQLLQTAL